MRTSWFTLPLVTTPRRPSAEVGPCKLLRLNSVMAAALVVHVHRDDESIAQGATMALPGTHCHRQMCASKVSRGRMTSAHNLPTPAAADDAYLHLVVAAYLARYKGDSRKHTASDLRVFLDWCSRHELAPLVAKRAHIELFMRWMQEVQRYKPSTVSRRLSVVTGFYRTCVIDGVLDHSPADYVRRPHVPPDSPTLGLSHLQFEALLTAGRDSPNPNDFALVSMLGLLGLRIFEATGANIEALSEVHGHRVLRVHGKGDKIALVPLPPAVGRAIDRAATCAPDRQVGVPTRDCGCLQLRLRRWRPTAAARAPPPWCCPR